MTEIRCPGCERLVARKLKDGRVEIRQRGRPLAVLKSGESELYCARCGLGIGVNLSAAAGRRDLGGEPPP